MKEKEISKLYNSITNVDNQFIEEAQTKTKKKNGWLKWAAMAACLCVALVAGVLFKISVPDVIIAPGFLTITVYAASSDEEITMQEGIHCDCQKARRNDNVWNRNFEKHSGYQSYA